MRPGGGGGDDGLGRLERTPSLRLPVVEHGPLEASTPQGEDMPSPFGSQNSANAVLKILFSFFNCVVCACLNIFTPPIFCLFVCLALLQDESGNTLSQRRSPAPSLDRLAPERVSKRSSLSLDLNANENGQSEQSGSESLEDGERTHPEDARARVFLYVCRF